MHFNEIHHGILFPDDTFILLIHGARDTRWLKSYINISLNQTEKVSLFLK